MGVKLVLGRGIWSGAGCENDLHSPSLRLSLYLLFSVHCACSLVPRPSRLHAIILRAIIWVAFEKREGLVDLVM